MSLSRELYDKLKSHAESNGISMSGIVERTTNAFIDEAEAAKQRECEGLKQDRLALIANVARKQAG